MNVKKLLPPILVDLLLRSGFAGNRFKHGYGSWDEAKSKCTGYDSEIITESILSSARLVRDGKAVYERDGVVFDEVQYSWPLLSALLGTPLKDRTLRVLDWGGALGSSYRQNKDLLKASGLSISWTVLEQTHLVDIGNSEFTNEELKFVRDVTAFFPRDFDVVLFASTICYLDNYSEVLNQAVSLNPTRIIFDRTPESKTLSDLIGIQRIGRAIYKANYPIRSFAKSALAEFLKPNYELLSEWESDLQPDPQTIAKGYVFSLS